MTVDTGNSVKTIKDLKDQITQLKKALDEEAVGSEEAKKASDDLANAQNLLKQAMKGSTDTINIATGSYKDLERQCEKLKLTYKSMADGIEKQKIGKQIADIQENLKKQDAAIGDFKRNVGDYANAFGSALGSMGVAGASAMNAIAGGAKGVKGVFDLLKAHPIFAIIAAFVVVVQALVNAFKKNEDAVNKLKVAFGPFEGILNAINTAVGKLVDLIANGLVAAFNAAAGAASKFIGWLQSMAEKLGMDDLANSLAKVNERMAEGAEISKEEVALQKEARDVRVQNAKAQAEIVKLQTEFKKAAGDTAKQAKIAQQIETEQQKIKQRNYDLAKKEYELAVKKDKQSPNSTEENERTIAAYEKMLQAEAALYDVSKEQTKVWKAESAEMSANEKELERNAKKREELVHSLTAWQEMNGQSQLAKLKKQYDDELKLLEDNEEAKKILTQKYVTERTKIEQEQANKKITDNASLDTTEEQIVNNLTKAENIKNSTIYELNKVQEQEEYEHQQRLLEIQMDALEERKGVLEGIINNEETFNQLSQEERDRYIQELEQTNAQIALTDSQRTLLEAQESQKRIKEAEREKKMKMQVGLSMANSVADIFGAIADSMDENNKEQFEAAKAFNIASATINTITGAIGAYMGAASNPGLNAIPVVGPALAIAMGVMNAAAVTAGGIANITKLAQQKYDDKSGNASTSFNSATPSQSAINAVTAPVQYTTAVEGASIDENISNQKVYVAETDLQAVANRVNVQETENRY